MAKLCCRILVHLFLGRWVSVTSCPVEQLSWSFSRYAHARMLDSALDRLLDIRGNRPLKVEIIQCSYIEYSTIQYSFIKIVVRTLRRWHIERMYDKIRIEMYKTKVWWNKITYHYEQTGFLCNWGRQCSFSSQRLEWRQWASASHHTLPTSKVLTPDLL